MNDLPTEQSAEGSSIIAVNSQGEAVKIPSSAVGAGSSVAVVDNLNSNSSTSALSARQGKALNTRVTALENGGGHSQKSLNYNFSFIFISNKS